MPSRELTRDELLNYRAGIEQLRQTRSARHYFRERIRRIDAGLDALLERRKAVAEATARLPDTRDNREGAMILYELQDAERADLLRERKRWERLLGKPGDGGAAFRDRIERAKRVPIETLFDPEKGTRTQSRLHCLCPFHSEKTASFVIFLNDNRFKCFGGCGAYGDSIDFYQKLMNVTLTEALDNLCGKV